MDAKKQIVTPKKAAEWIKRNVNNRPLSQGTVAQYARAMGHGAWKVNGDAIRFNGNGDLLDGQHRLHACIKSGKSFETYVISGLEHDAFDTIDQGKKRTIGDVFSRQGYKHYSTLAAAVRWIWIYENLAADAKSCRTPFPVRPDEANEVLEKHPAVHAAVEDARKFASCRMIHPGLLAFLVYYTSIADEHLSKLFWQGVCDSTGLKKGDAAYLLNKRLRENISATTTLPTETIAALCIKAWNASYLDKPLGTLKWHSDELFPRFAKKR